MQYASKTQFATQSNVLGTPVNVLSFVEAQDRVLAWGQARESRYVVLANVHVVVTAAREPDFGAVVAAADLATPDGAPVAWMLRKLGHAGQERVSGPDLTWALLARCAAEGLPVYFFGSSRETLGLLAERINAAFPALVVAGFEAPPFRPMTPAEDAEAVARINASGAGLEFVGLGCPKQEHWMLAHRGRVNAVMLGVGAAFDFHAGTVSRAPTWMREHGLEWLHRLASEPRRLWRRYLVTNTLFVLGAARQLLGAWWVNERPVNSGIVRAAHQACTTNMMRRALEKMVAQFAEVLSGVWGGETAINLI